MTTGTEGARSTGTHGAIPFGGARDGVGTERISGGRMPCHGSSGRRPGEPAERGRSRVAQNENAKPIVFFHPARTGARLWESCPPQWTPNGSRSVTRAQGPAGSSGSAMPVATTAAAHDFSAYHRPAMRARRTGRASCLGRFRRRSYDVSKQLGTYSDGSHVGQPIHPTICHGLL